MMEMMERHRIECAKEDDRDALAMILVRNGYTVRRHRERAKKGNAYVHYIEYWKEIGQT